MTFNHDQFSVLRANTCQIYRFTFKILKLLNSLKVLKNTICFGQYGHPQVWTCRTDKCLHVGRRIDRDWVESATGCYNIIFRWHTLRPIYSRIFKQKRSLWKKWKAATVREYFIENGVATLEIECWCLYSHFVQWILRPGGQHYVLKKGFHDNKIIHWTNVWNTVAEVTETPMKI
jgi:hypothetical protein